MADILNIIIQLNFDGKSVGECLYQHTCMHVCMHAQINGQVTNIMSLLPIL